jgi:hypothetical protein
LVVVFLGELNDLIQPGAGLGEAGVTESLERMRRGAAQAPIEGFWLVAEHITGLIRPAPPCRCDRHGKPFLLFYFWIVDVIFGRGHRQTDHQRCAGIEQARRQHQEGMPVTHLPTDLWIAIDPHDILAVRHPGGRPCRAHQRSAPSVSLVIASPPCRAGSNRASRFSRLKGTSATGVMTTRPSSAEMRTR